MTMTNSHIRITPHSRPQSGPQGAPRPTVGTSLLHRTGRCSGGFSSSRWVACPRLAATALQDGPSFARRLDVGQVSSRPHKSHPCPGIVSASAGAVPGGHRQCCALSAGWWLPGTAWSGRRESSRLQSAKPTGGTRSKGASATAVWGAVSSAAPHSHGACGGLSP